MAVAAALRIGFVAMGRVVSPLRADAGQYAQYAANLVDHGTFSLATANPPAPDSFRSPGYPLFLAACRWLGGDGWPTLAIAAQVVLGTLTVLLCYHLARRFVGFGPAIAAASLCALSPHLVVSSAFVLTECVTTFVVTAGLWLCAGAAGTRRFVAGAALLGLATLCNEAYVFLPLVAAWSVWRVDRRRALLALAVGLLPFAAWTLRNQTTRLACTGSQRAVASVSHGSYPGMVFRDPQMFGFPYREDPEQPAMAGSWRSLWHVLGPRIAAEPLRYATWYALEKPIWLWSWPLVQGRDVCVYEVANSPYDNQPVVQATHVAMRWLHAPVMALAALAALVAAVRRRSEGEAFGRRALALVVVLATLAYVPVIPDPRYLQPVRPLVFAFAAIALQVVVARLGARAKAKAAPAAAAADA